jgi:hypothetical protein
VNKIAELSSQAAAAWLEDRPKQLRDGSPYRSEKDGQID